MSDALLFVAGLAGLVIGATLLVDGGQHLMRFERDFSLM